MRKLALVGAAAVACLAFGCVLRSDASSSRRLASDGVPSACIVIDAENPTRSAQLAAFELQHVVMLMTGATLPIVSRAEDVRGTPIFVGGNRAAKKLGLADPLKGEEYVVEFKDDCIVLAGNDSPDYGKVDYSDIRTFPRLQYSFRGSMFAVYDFLEKCCGVRFYYFGDDGIAMEKRSSLEVATVSIRFTPKMDAERWPNFDHIHTGAKPVPARDEALLMMRWRAALIYGGVNHNVWSIYYRYWGRAQNPELAKVFMEKRPEYFAKGYEGSSSPSAIKSQYPNDPDLPPQLCTSSPGPVKYFAEEACKVLNGEKVPGAVFAGVKKMPGKPFLYPMQEDDSSYWCKCENCEGSFRKVAPESRYAYQHFDWINRIAESAAKLNPEIGIATLAYNDSLLRPDPAILKLQPNVSVKLCLSVQSWYLPLIYSESRRVYKDWIENEGPKRPITIWTYMLCPAWEAQIIYKYKQFFPMSYPWRAGRIFKEFANDGVRGYFNEIDHVFHMLEAYVANKVCFDPSVDTDKIVDEYFAMYYGAAAGPMRRFYKTLEDITWNPANYPENVVKTPHQFGGSFVYGIHTEKTNWRLGSPERMAELQKIVDEAQGLASSPVEKQRVKWFVDNIWAQAVEGRKAFEKREQSQAGPVPQLGADYAGECGGDPEKVDFSQAAKADGWAASDGSASALKPELSLASDSKFLYVRFHEAGDLAFKKRKAGFWENNVEIFLAPKPEHPYGQLALAPSGEFKALKHQVVNGVMRMDDWDVAPVIKNTLDETGWTFLMAIPLKKLLPSQEVLPGGMLFANFMRTRSFEGGSSCLWSPTFSPSYAEGLDRMGRIYIAPVKSGSGEIPVNGEFKPDFSGAMPEGWVHNKLATLEPHGDITLSQGRVGVASRGKWVYLYLKKIFPARRGDQIVLEFVAKGRGVASAAAYFYDASNTEKFLGMTQKEFELSGEDKEFKIILPVTNVSKSNSVAGFRPVLTASPGASVEYSRLKVSVVPRGGQP